jgi:hypothetical protein
MEPNSDPVSRGAPARLVVEVFGETRAAEIAGVRVDAVRKWRRKRASGGGGGLIPARYQHAYLTAAALFGVELTPADLIGQPY